MYYQFDRCGRYDTLPAGVKLVGNVYLDGKVALHKLSGNALSVLVGDLAAGESMLDADGNEYWI